MQAAKKASIIVIALAAVCAALALLVPMPSSWTDGKGLYYGTLSLTFAYVALHVGAVVLFWMGVGAYTKKLRRSYLIICSGIIALALGTLQLPIISALNLWGSAWVTHGFVGMLFLIAEFDAYFGARSLAKLIGTKTVLTKYIIVLPVLIALSAATSLLPHVTSTTPEGSYDVSVAVFAFGALMYVTAAALMLRVKQQIGAHYTNAMAWLFLGFSGSSGALILATLATLLSNKNQDGWSLAIDTVALLAGLAYVKAGLAFVKTKEY